MTATTHASISRTAGPVLFRIRSSGPRADWILRLRHGDVPVKFWRGFTEDVKPDEFSVEPEAVLHADSEMSWMVVYFGTTKTLPFHLVLDVIQNEQEVCEKIDIRAEVPARRPHFAFGQIVLHEAHEAHGIDGAGGADGVTT